MARKHGSKPSNAKSRSSRAPRKTDGRMKRWETREDIPQDEIDRFHNSKDRILLDGEDGGSDEDDEDDEVFALKGMPEDSDEEEGEEDEDEDGAEDDDDDEDIDLNLPGPSTLKANKTKGKGKKTSPPTSDASESESEEEGWGKKKSEYYASNAEQLDSEDEEANEMEEQEAKRLQTKAREVLTEDDFGLGDAAEALSLEQDNVLEEPVASAIETLPQDKPSLLRHLEKTNPEALALARDWEDVAYSLMETQAKIDALEAEENEDPESNPHGMTHLHYQALQTYATTLSFYLYLRASEKYASKPELLRAHPIMARLLILKQSIATLEDLNQDYADDDIDEEEDAKALWDLDQLKDMDPEELRELMREAEELMGGKLSLNGITGDEEVKTEKKSKKSKKEKKSDDPLTVFSSAEEPPKKRRKTSKSESASLPVFDLVEPTFPSKSSKPSTSQSTIDNSSDPYGELTVLSSADAQDKASRKRSLRFHTSKIESASARREKARVGAYGGDDDIPWKERKKEKKVPVAQRGMGGDDLDDLPADLSMDVDGDSGRKAKRGKAEDGDDSSESDGEGYYDLVKRKSKEKKEKKKAEYEALAAAERVVPDDDPASGPRGLTHAILSNKGLTPHRSKSVRNPRVKKRQKFEKAKKKVSSQKAVFKGGAAATGGRYDGERSGISKVIKSVKL